MATEKRVVSDKKKIGAKGGSSDGGEDGEVQAKGGKKKLILIGAVVAIAAAGAGYFFVLAPKNAAAAEAAGEEAVEEEPVELGAVMVVDSVSINLSGGHYLRLGLGLQLSAEAGAHGEPDTARALDLAIELFSQQPLEAVNDPTERAALKAELVHQLEETYHGDVIDVYFTDFVTQ